MLWNVWLAGQLAGIVNEATEAEALEAAALYYSKPCRVVAVNQLTLYDRLHPEVSQCRSPLTHR